jgi:predicted transposase YbfD/YdcC
MDIIEHFRNIPDPRIERCKLHPLESIIALTVISVICGAEGWETIEEFGKSKEEFLKTIIPLPHGIPSHDTLERVFERLNPIKFEEVFMAWCKQIHQKSEGQFISIDGKTIRGSRDTFVGKSAIHLVSAWACENHIVLGHVKVAGKDNEIQAIKELLTLLDLSGSVITIDAMGCQKAIAQQIIEKEADYILAVKGNQEELFIQIINLFEKRIPDNKDEWLDKDHGRIETRTCTIINNLDWIEEEKSQWCSLNTVIKIEAKREVQGKTSTEVRYYISSLKENANYFNKAIRGHWGIENSQHWVLDVGFREDESRKRKGYSDENFAIVRRIALNAIKKEKSTRMGVNNKRLKAGWNDNYLISILKNL